MTRNSRSIARSFNAAMEETGRAYDLNLNRHGYIVRNYQMRGMLQPCECTDCGYGIYDESALSRLCFIRAGKKAGISLNDFEILCKALDEQDKK
ncbi:hypothetical protein MNBD_GAMMA19-2221 [hydrothermal vent metagenome]|uniref:HTH merR-type domain-containing protein n=1 Tax=hydrothermal vent metagenome TaxID=652676 RepID=A0A3B1ABH2_9ZZZZ